MKKSEIKKQNKYFSNEIKRLKEVTASLSKEVKYLDNENDVAYDEIRGLKGELEQARNALKIIATVVEVNK